MKQEKGNTVRYGTEQQSGLKITAVELRGTAQFLEREILEALNDFSDVSPALTEGDLKVFPRPAPEHQAAEEGFSFLRQKIQNMIASLYALALASERNGRVPPVLLTIVEPYVNAYRAQKVTESERK